MSRPPRGRRGRRGGGLPWRSCSTSSWAWCAVGGRRMYQEEGSAPHLALPPAAREGFESALPFALTAAQRRAIDEVLRDIGGSVPMSRLLEGDVGSGKTVVAATALLAAVAGGYQGAIMAPTEALGGPDYPPVRGL